MEIVYTARWLPDCFIPSNSSSVSYTIINFHILNVKYSIIVQWIWALPSGFFLGVFGIFLSFLFFFYKRIQTLRCFRWLPNPDPTPRPPSQVSLHNLSEAENGQSIAGSSGGETGGAGVSEDPRRSGENEPLPSERKKKLGKALEIFMEGEFDDPNTLKATLRV